MNIDYSAGTLIGAGAGIGIITGFWHQIRGYISRIFQLVFVKSIISGPVSKDAIIIYLVKNYKCLNVTFKPFWGTTEYVRPKQRNELIVTALPPCESSLWYKKGSLISITLDPCTCTIRYVRGTFNIESFITESINYYNESRKNKDWKTGYDRYRIIRYSGSIGSKSHNDSERIIYNKSQPEEAPVATQDTGGSYTEAFRTTINDQEIRYDICKPLQWTKDQLGQPKKDSPVDLLSLKQNILDAVEEAIRWRSSEEWFKMRNIPWKRGWVLFGDPGTGKTAFIRALGQELNMPITMFDLSTMTNQDFVKYWETAMGNTPCIVLLEDVDAIFDGRKNVAVQGLNQGVSFDCLLNTVDGVQNTDGMFFIVTTNNIEKLDPALGNPMANGEGKESMSTRPGRIDRAIKFEHLDDDGRRKMAKRIFDGIQEEKWQHLLNKGDKDTGAQFQERCCRLALKLFWEKA